MRNLFLSGICAGFLFVSGFATPALAKEDAEATAGPTIQFVELAPLILPVINAEGVTQMISLVVAVEVDSQEKADKVTKYQPRLTDAYLSDLYGAFSQKMPEGGVLPISFLKERLNIMSNKVLGEEVVSDVLVQVLQSRRT